MPLRFVQNTPVPREKTEVEASGWFWKVRIREWSFLDLDVVDNKTIPPSYVAGTNNFYAIRKFDRIECKKPNTATLRIYGFSPGSAYVYLKDTSGKNPNAPVEDVQMFVEVLPRNAGKPEDVTLTELKGKTFVSNAPDTPAYTMDVTRKFNPPMTGSPVDIFNEVPSAANHVVVACHGDSHIRDKPLLFIAGKSRGSFVIGMDNVTDVFGKLKGRVDSGKCIVWLAGCTVGSSKEFCLAAANASGCPVIATYTVLDNKSFPQGKIEMLDRRMGAVLFRPGGSKTDDLGQLCMEQENYQFVVPI